MMAPCDWLHWTIEWLILCYL